MAGLGTLIPSPEGIWRAFLSDLEPLDLATSQPLVRSSLSEVSTDHAVWYYSPTPQSTPTLAVQTSLSCVFPAFLQHLSALLAHSISLSTLIPLGRFPFFLCLSSSAKNNIWHIVLSLSKNVKYWTQYSNLCFISVYSRKFPSGLNIYWRLQWVPFSFQGIAGKGPEKIS